jgi:hypothetical protein
MKWKHVGIYSPAEKLYRLGRVMGSVGNVGDGKGYSWKCSLAIGWRFPFLRLKYQRAYGGIYT